MSESSTYIATDLNVVGISHPRSSHNWLRLNRSRWERLCNRYTVVLNEWRRIDRDSYDFTLSSRSLETDPLVTQILADSNIDSALFLDDAWFACRWIWTDAVQRAQLGNEPGWDFFRVVNDLEAGNVQQVKSLGDRKGQLCAILPPSASEREAAVPNGLCNIMGCNAPGQFVLNSISYCGTHLGLSLFNALRHGHGDYQCNACVIFNAVALKYTLTDYGHAFHASRVLKIPRSDTGNDTRDLNDDHARVRVELFIAGERPVRPLVFVKNASGLVYRSHTSGRMQKVPDGVFVHTNNGGRVIAWIRVFERSIQTGDWIPVQSIRRLENLENELHTGRLLRYRTNQGELYMVIEGMDQGWKLW